MGHVGRSCRGQPPASTSSTARARAATSAQASGHFAREGAQSRNMEIAKTIPPRGDRDRKAEAYHPISENDQWGERRINALKTEHNG